ncbi:MAG: CBS domain-containing protein, partial [Planctomycetia bacterium]|nr:CBS domain-containing protein [Planctomycetia bacterium]
MATDARDKRNPTAADVMTHSPRTCSPFSTVLEAVLIFRDADCGAVPVVDANQAVGVLTDRDVALALADHSDLAGLPVSDVMTRGAVTVAPDASLEDVKAQFGAHGVRRLLVADATGQL